MGIFSLHNSGSGSIGDSVGRTLPIKPWLPLSSLRLLDRIAPVGPFGEKQIIILKVWIELSAPSPAPAPAPVISPAPGPSLAPVSGPICYPAPSPALTPTPAPAPSPDPVFLLLSYLIFE